MAAHDTSRMQSLFVDAVQVARDLFQVDRDPFHGRSYSSTVLVTNVSGYDLDDYPSTTRRVDHETALGWARMSCMRG
eukprot:9485690-Pyramimonas_sp.AAC.1